MAKTTGISPPKGGGTSTGGVPKLAFESPPELIDRIDAWRRQQGEPTPSREEAIRRLIEKALADEAPDRGSIPLEDLNASNDE
jgi:hypothetical protein